MNEIICPHCKKAFKIDEAGYADILKQVRDHQFEEEASKRLSIADNEKQHAVQLAEANLKNLLQNELARKDLELSELKAQTANELTQQLSAKEKVIQELQASLQQTEIEKKLSVAESIKEIERERDRLSNELKTKETKERCPSVLVVSSKPNSFNNSCPLDQSLDISSPHK